MAQPYRRPDQNDLEHLGDDEDIQFYVSLARSLKPQSVFELACTGRITILLAEEGARSGYSVVGRLELERVGRQNRGTDASQHFC